MSMANAQQKITDSHSGAKIPQTEEQQNATIHPEALLLHALNAQAGTQILQFGNNNVVAIESEQMQATQTGDYQLLFYTKTSTLIPSDMQVNMEGANNYVEIIGNNSIVENMTINIQGDNRSLTVRSY